jgi:glycosyltransferase involved in cell wall biosynthesis
MTFSTAELCARPLISPEERMDSNLRVLHVLEATLGGTLRYLENMTAALTPSPINFGLAYSTRRADHRLEPALEVARRLGWRLFPIDMRREVHPASDMSCAYTLARAIRSFRPAIVHCHSSKAGVLGRIASYGTLPRPRVVYSPHAVAPQKHYLRIERTFNRFTDRFLAVSDSERDQLLGLGLGTTNSIGVVYPTIDTEVFAPRNLLSEREALSLPDGAILLGIGRMTQQKRPLDLLEVLKSVRASIPSAVAVWVGDGEQRTVFEQKAQEMGLTPYVRVTGWVKDVRPYIGAASVVVSTSAFESFGYNVAEALAMERPVVATRVCGTRDILASSLGDVFFEVGDAADAAQKCIAILRSRTVSEELGREGRKAVINRFSMSRMREGLVAFYSEMLAPDLREALHG